MFLYFVLYVLEELATVLAIIFQWPLEVVQKKGAPLFFLSDRNTKYNRTTAT